MSVQSRVACMIGSERPSAARRDVAGVIAPPPLIYLGGLALGFALQAVLPAPSIPAAVQWGLGAVLALAGFVLARAFFRALRRASTPVDPYSATSTLVVSGPYRLTRNPGYLAMALAYVGISLLAGALWPLASLLPTLVAIDRGVIVREERYLQRRFGEQYSAFKARTRRWL
jgi:protein-S-isoprenylcysteine O-methyltransferase Ste14